MLNLVVQVIVSLALSSLAWFVDPRPPMLVTESPHSSARALICYHGMNKVSVSREGILFQPRD